MLLKDIYRDILEVIKNDLLEEMGKDEVERYYRNFPYELDFNIVNEGNLLVYYDDIRKFFEKYGIITEYADNEEIWNFYKGLVGNSVMEIISNQNIPITINEE